jgi:hypothetical protein
VAEKDADSAAVNGVMLAETRDMLGRASEVAASVAKASADSKDETIIYRGAHILIAAKQEAKASQLAASLAQRLETEPQVYAKLIAGELHLKKSNARDDLHNSRGKLADTWLVHFDMSFAYLSAGAFTEASSEFDTCLKRKGEAIALFLDDVPSFHLLPAVYYYQGRAREGLRSPGAAESYKLFLSIKEKGAGDPLVADAQRRISSLTSCLSDASSKGIYTRY